jgi:hypothetical protein
MYTLNQHTCVKPHFKNRSLYEGTEHKYYKWLKNEDNVTLLFTYVQSFQWIWIKKLKFSFLYYDSN